MSILISAFLSLLLPIAFACPSGQVQQGTQCVPCPPGTYRVLGTEEKCEPCPAGTFQPFDGVRVASLCKYCGPGTFSATPGAANCTACPLGTTSQRNATQCSRCPPNTKHAEFGDGCEACPEGPPTPGFNNLECTECPEIPTAGLPGCPSMPSCELNRFFDWATRTCVPCPHGTVSEEGTGRLIDCRPCPKNTFRRVRFPSGGPKTCLNCPAGTSTNGRGATFCRRPGEECPKDAFVNSRGDCEQCSRGFRYIPEENRCARCPANTKSRGLLETECEPCPGNLQADPNRFTCGCKPGFFLVNETFCSPCPAGGAQENFAFRGRGCGWCGFNSIDNVNFVFVSLRRGSATCEFCPLGTVPSRSHDRCVKCPPGFTTARSQTFRLVSNETTMESSTGIINAHETCVDIRTGCTSAQELVEDVNSMEVCRPIPCSRNSTRSDLGRNCMGCSLNFILSEDSPGCSYCGDSAVSSGGLATECQQCPPGWEARPGRCFCPLKMIVADDGSCQNCAPGTQAVQAGNGTRTCEACPSGTFRSSESDFRCSNCPKNSVSTEGASSCTPCPSGFEPNKIFRPDECIAIGNSRR